MDIHPNDGRSYQEEFLRDNDRNSRGLFFNCGLNRLIKVGATSVRQICLGVLISQSLFFMPCQVEAENISALKIGGIWTYAKGKVDESENLAQPIPTLTNYNHEADLAQDRPNGDIFTAKLGSEANLWGRLASEVEIWEQKKKLAKLKAETQDLENLRQVNGGSIDWESFKPMVQNMIHESLRSYEAEKSKNSVNDGVKKNTAIKWPKVVSIHGTKSLKCTLRLADGQTTQASVGENVAGFYISKITRGNVWVKHGSQRMMLNFE